MPTRYLLLVRHASREKKWDQSESGHLMKAWRYDYYFEAADAGKPGLPVTCGLAGQLCDQLEIKDIKVSRIFHSQHKVAEQTAMVFAHVLGERERLTNTAALDVECEGLPALTPGDAKENDKDVIGTISGSLTCLVIGHQPQLTRIARGVFDKSLVESDSFQKVRLKLKRKILFNYSLPGNVLPLGSSEIACIELGENPRLLWLMTEKSKDLLTELKAKIASKYDVAKFFLGALVVGTGLTLNDAVWNLPATSDKVIACMGAFAALVSLGFTAATLFSYDRLLMPQDFWLGADRKDDESHGIVRWLRSMRGAESAWSVSRPPSQAHVILFYEMVHIWTHLFIPAIASAFAAVGLVVAARAHRSVSGLTVSDWIPSFLRWPRLVIVLLFALFAFLLGWRAFHRWKPSLGFDD